MGCGSCGSNGRIIPHKVGRSTNLPKPSIMPQLVVATYNINNRRTVNIKPSNSQDIHRA